MILFAVPRHIRDRKGAGNWKDVEATQILLDRLGRAYERVDFDPEAPGDLLRGRDGVRDLLVHYSWWPDALGQARRNMPGLRIHVRAHNAEALQHLHRSSFRPLPSAAQLRTAYGAGRLLLRDLRCRRLADTILGISAWDNAHYWRRLPGRAAVRHLPYFSPWPLLLPETRPRPWPERDAAVLCMPGARDAISTSMIDAFGRLAALGLTPWRFLLTRGILSNGDAAPLPPKVEMTASDDEPWPALCRVRAVAVLTPLGFGTKTTIVDALAAGCHVLVHPALHGRLSAAEREACTPLDPDRPPSREHLGRLLEEPPRAAWRNETLADEARAVLTASLSG